MDELIYFQLRELKNTAASLERFTLADKARQAIASLREIGYEHGKLLVIALITLEKTSNMGLPFDLFSFQLLPKWVNFGKNDRRMVYDLFT